jgi:hypothetical protein
MRAYFDRMLMGLTWVCPWVGRGEGQIVGWRTCRVWDETQTSEDDHWEYKTGKAIRGGPVWTRELNPGLTDQTLLKIR